LLCSRFSLIEELLLPAQESNDVDAYLLPSGRFLSNSRKRSSSSSLLFDDTTAFACRLRSRHDEGCLPRAATCAVRLSIRCRYQSRFHSLFIRRYVDASFVAQIGERRHRRCRVPGSLATPIDRSCSFVVDLTLLFFRPPIAAR
jgi:hypothetical protein